MPGPTWLTRPPMCAPGSRRIVPPTTLTSRPMSAVGPISSSPPTTTTSWSTWPSMRAAPPITTTSVTISSASTTTRPPIRTRSSDRRVRAGGGGSGDACLSGAAGGTAAGGGAAGGGGWAADGDAGADGAPIARRASASRYESRRTRSASAPSFWRSSPPVAGAPSIEIVPSVISIDRTPRPGVFGWSAIPSWSGRMSNRRSTCRRSASVAPLDCATPFLAVVRASASTSSAVSRELLIIAATPHRNRATVAIHMRRARRSPSATSARATPDACSRARRRCGRSCRACCRGSRPR